MDVAAKEEEPPVLTGDPCWELVQRIVAAPCFSKSERLSSFLLFVCRLSLLGEDHKINEQNIGRAVFERKADYDTAIDGIVRTHATRLRRRLQEYFDEHGHNETLIVEIPRGSYVPVFRARRTTEPLAVLHSGPVVPTVSAMLPTATVGAAEPGPESAVRRGKMVRFRHIAFLVALAWSILSIGYLVTHPRLLTEMPAEWKNSHNLLWQQIFNKNTDTLVVSGDMALVNFEIQTNHSVMLGEYARNTYVKQYMDQFALESYSPSSALFLTKTLTVVDSQFIEQVLRSPGIDLDRTRFSSARNIQLPDLRSGNIVLLGNSRFNPWVQAFEPKMNFYFADSSSELTNSVLMNRSPRSNEQGSYISSDVNHVHTEYSVIAFQPNLSGSGNALLLEGQSEISTEAAEKFVLNDVDLIPFLGRIRRNDGSLPHFELVLQVKGMGGNAASYEILAYRVNKD